MSKNMSLVLKAYYLRPILIIKIIYSVFSTLNLILYSIKENMLLYKKSKHCCEMFSNNVPVLNNDLPNVFEEFFTQKTANIVNDTKIEDNVYNGRRKLFVNNEDFMLPSKVLYAAKSLKIKNRKGHDIIPQRILIDGIQYLLDPFSSIFNKIYKSKPIPEQWLISKVNPIFKMGNPKNIENYKPISNLCSASKIFEK